MLFNADYTPQAHEAHLNPTDMQLRFDIVPSLSGISPHLAVVDNSVLGKAAARHLADLNEARACHAYRKEDSEAVQPCREHRAILLCCIAAPSCMGSLTAQ